MTRSRALVALVAMSVSVLLIAALPGVAADDLTAGRVPHNGLLAVQVGDSSDSEERYPEWESALLVDTAGTTVLDLGAVVWPQWSPDGTKISYQTEFGGALVVADRDGSNPVVVSDRPSAASWSPQGGKLVVSERDEASETTSTFVVNDDGTGRSWLFDAAAGPWSPDGRRIAYTIEVDDESGGYSTTWVHDLGTGLDQEVGLWSYDVSWSPDSRRLIGSGDPSVPVEFQGPGLWIFDLETSQAEEIPGSARGGERRVTWAPAGDVVAYMSWASPPECCRQAVHLLNVETGLVSMLQSPSGILEPSSGTNFAWSPDGQHIVADWEETEGFVGRPVAIALHRLDGSVVWDSGSSASPPSGASTVVWAPDGSGFLWPPPDRPDVWEFVELDGSTTELPVSGWVLDWQPVFLQDIADSVFVHDIEWLWDAHITKGCNPPWNDFFCPDDPVTRGQFAAFMSRALGLTDRLDDPFNDDDGSTFEADIGRLAASGITRGCNPPTNDKFCPDDYVTRGAFAAFMVRAMGYTDNGGGDLFIDDDNSIFENDIDKLATAGVTKGCNPPANTQFCPDDYMTRGQLAAFFHRALQHLFP